MGVGLQREADVGVAGKGLSHLGRDTCTFQAGDEEVPATVKVGVAPVLVLVGEEVGLLPLLTTGGELNFAPDRLDRTPR